MKILLINLGTQEPRVSYDGGKSPFRTISENFGVEAELRKKELGANGLFAACQKIPELWSLGEQQERLRYPIVQAALHHAQPVDELVVIGTNGVTDEERRTLQYGHPNLNDTLAAARLLQEWIADEPEMSSYFVGGVAKVTVLELRDSRLHLFRNASRELARVFEPVAGAEYQVCLSPGLPSVNSAILQRLLRKQAKAAFFQVSEPLDPTIRADGKTLSETEAVPEVSILEAVLGWAALGCVERYQFGAALAVVARWTDSNAKSAVVQQLETANHRWLCRVDEDGWDGVPEDRKEWSRWLNRALLGVRGTHALFSLLQQDDVDIWPQALTRWADTWAFISELARAVECGGIQFMEKKTREIESKRWSEAVRHAVYRNLTKYERLRKLRNDAVHRFEAVNAIEARKVIRGFCIREDFGSIADKPEDWPNGLEKAHALCQTFERMIERLARDCGVEDKLTTYDFHRERERIREAILSLEDTYAAV